MKQIGPEFFVREPTVADLVEIETRSGDPKAIVWYVARFLAKRDGSPWFKDDELDAAGRVQAWVGTAVVKAVGEMITAPHVSGEAADAPPRLETRPAGLNHRGPSRLGTELMDCI